MMTYVHNVVNISSIEEMWVEQRKWVESQKIEKDDFVK